MKYDVVTIGDAFEDVFILPEEVKIKKDRSFASGESFCFEVGDKISLENVDYEIGGSACNTAVGFEKMGFNSSIVSVIGEDTPAEKITQRLQDEGVDTSNLLIDKNLKTNFSVIFRLKENRTIFVYHGLKDYSKIRIKKNTTSGWIFLAPMGDNIEGIEKDIMTKIAEKDSCLAWNPGVIQIKKGANKFKNLLKNTSVLFLNREEAIEFSGYLVRPQDEVVIKKLHSMGPKIVVVTYGKEGAKAFDGKNFYNIQGQSNIEKVDSTGAGDSFSVGFLSRLMEEDWSKDIDKDMVAEALKWGIVNSGSVIGAIGAQKGLLNKADIESTIKQNRLVVDID